MRTAPDVGQRHRQRRPVGCVLVRTEKLLAIGGVAAIKDAIIDDCTLARTIKQSSGRIWIGLSNDACAVRPYDSLGSIWDMVARSAYTQLGYSRVLLLGCTALMIVGAQITSPSSTQASDSPTCAAAVPATSWRRSDG